MTLKHPVAQWSDTDPIPGPDITSSVLPSGAGTVLFVTDGRVETLEIFAYGDEFPEVLTDFELAVDCRPDRDEADGDV